MGLLDQALNGAGGYYNLIFLLLFFIFSALFLKYLIKKKHDKAFFCFLFALPISIKTPNLFTIYERYDHRFPVYEGLTIYSVFLLLFLYSIRKDAHFHIIKKIAKRKKLYIIGIVTAFFFGLSQQLALPTDFGILLGYTKIVEPFLFTIISSYIFFKYYHEYEKLIIWIGVSILYSVLFSIASGLAINYDYAGVLRLGGGSIGSATVAAAIFVTWAIIFIGLFFISKKKKSKIILLLLFSILSFAALMAHSRGPLGYYVLGLFLLYFIFPKGVRYKILRIAFIIAPLAVLTLYGPVSEEISKRNFDISKIDEDSSFQERIDRNSTALDHVTSSMLGIGFADPKGGSRHDQEYEVYFHVYNTPLAWATFGGLFSGVGFILLNLIVWRLALIKPKKHPTTLLLAGIFKVALLCWFIDYFTTGNNLLFGYPFSSVIYFYLIPGFILGNYTRSVVQQKIDLNSSIRHQDTVK